MVVHPIEPVYDENSEILILGSFPSVKSRENHFFYGHPQNRFWKVLAAVFEGGSSKKYVLETNISEESIPGTVVLGAVVPQTIQEKKNFLLKHHVAIWDVIQSCDIEGSSDSSIRNVQANDISPVLQTSQIRQIYVNGKKAEQLYQKYIYPKVQRDCICLPSTSPANAAWSLERLVETWKSIRDI